MTSQQPVTVQIAKKQYQIDCGPEHVALLKESAELLNKRLDQIKRQGHALSTERTAMMAALNMAYELISKQKQQAAYIDTMGQKIHDLQEKIESALTEKS